MYEDARGCFPDEADRSLEGVSPVARFGATFPVLLALSAVLLVAATCLG